MNPIRYRGYYYDNETGYYYLQSRYYVPEWGRFLNADSQLNFDDGFNGINLFAYCGNNPVNCIDPDGHSFWSAVCGAVSGVIDFIFPGSSDRNKKAFNSFYDFGNWVTLGAFDTVKGAFAPKKPLSLQHWVDSVATVAMAAPVVGGIGKTIKSTIASINMRANTARTTSVLSIPDMRRIQNAANRTKQQITVVGSRANGSATLLSDWDYVLSGNSAQRHSARSSLPRGVCGGENGSGIDIFTNYTLSPFYQPLDTSKPHITFFPQ